MLDLCDIRVFPKKVKHIFLNASDFGSHRAAWKLTIHFWGVMSTGNFGALRDRAYIIVEMESIQSFAIVSFACELVSLAIWSIVHIYRTSIVSLALQISAKWRTRPFKSLFFLLVESLRCRVFCSFCVGEPPALRRASSAGPHLQICIDISTVFPYSSLNVFLADMGRHSSQLSCFTLITYSAMVCKLLNV